MIGGCSVLLDGVNDYVALGTVAARDFTSSPFTLMAWVYPTALPGANSDVLSNGFSGVSGYALRYLTSGLIRLRTTQAGPNQATESGVALPLNTWSFIAATRDGAEGVLYVNGEKDVAVAGAHIDPVASGGAQFCGSQGGSAAYFPGAIDEIAFFNVALTQEQIREYMYLSLTGNEPGCVSLHHFDDGLSNYASTTAMATKGGVNATLTNGAVWVYDRWAPWIEPRIGATSGLTISSHVATSVPGTLRRFIPRTKSRFFVSAQFAARVVAGGTGWVIGELLRDGVATAVSSALSFPAGIHRTSVPLVETLDVAAQTLVRLELAGRKDAAGSTISVAYDSPSTGYSIVAHSVDGTW